MWLETLNVSICGVRREQIAAIHDDVFRVESYSSV